MSIGLNAYRKDLGNKDYRNNYDRIFNDTQTKNKTLKSKQVATIKTQTVDSVNK